MQSLPTAITTDQLDSLLSTIGRLPDTKVTRHADIVTVHFTFKATGERVKLFSAATRNGTHWHAMAVPGLVSATFTA
jgi:uncharacterized protein (UPF0335 family)